MKNRFNLNEAEKNKIRSLHGIKPINEQTSMGPFVEDKSDMVTCAEQNYDIPPLVINMAGTIADRIMQFLSIFPTFLPRINAHFTTNVFYP